MLRIHKVLIIKDLAIACLVVVASRSIVLAQPPAAAAVPVSAAASPVAGATPAAPAVAAPPALPGVPADPAVAAAPGTAPPPAPADPAVAAASAPTVPPAGDPAASATPAAPAVILTPAPIAITPPPLIPKTQGIDSLAGTEPVVYERGTDPEAMRLVQQSVEAIDKIESGYVEVTGGTTLAVAGLPKRIHFPLKFRAWLQAGEPSKTYALTQFMGMAQATISDGKQELNYYPTLGEHTVKPAKQNVAGKLDDLVPTTAAQEMLSDFHTIRMAGVETVDGQRAHRIRLEGEKFVGDLWLLAQPQPMPVRLTGTAPVSKTEMAIDAKAQWTLNRPIPESIFAVTPPAGSREVAEVDSSRLQPDMVGPLVAAGLPNARALGGAAAPSARGGNAAPVAPPMGQSVPATLTGPPTPVTAPAAPATAPAAFAPAAVTPQ